MSATAGLTTYSFEARNIDNETARIVTEQVSEIEERVLLARAEMDSVAAFISQVNPDITAVSKYINGLSLSRSNSVPWIWAVVVSRDELPALVSSIRAQQSMDGFEVKGNVDDSSLTAPIALLAGPVNKDIFGTNLLAHGEFDKILTDAEAPMASQQDTSLVIVKAPEFPEDTVYMTRYLLPDHRQSQSAPWPSLILRGLTASNLQRAGRLTEEQSFRLLDESTAPPQQLLQRDGTSEVLAWLPASDFQVGEHRLALMLTPPNGTGRPRWWFPVLVTGVLLTGLYAALRSGFMVGKRATQLGSVLNSTERRLAETERREVAFFENAGTANCETDFTTGKLIRVNDSLCKLLDYSREELIGKSFSEITHPDDIALSRAALVDDQGRPKPSLQFEKRYLRKDGSTLWGLVNSMLHFDSTGLPRSYTTVIINIDDRKRDEITKALLTRELAHRVRNTVQLTSSLARQTSATARSVKEYDAKFHRRLAALSAAQDILFDRNWMSAPLSRIAQATFKPFLPEDKRQGDLAVSLPNVELPTQQAQTIAIALHELASNSSRYGALSNGGTVTVVGTLLESDDDGLQILHLKWDEESKKPVRKPRKSGFGSRMLLSAMPEQFAGRANATWRSSGLLYEAWLKIPKPEV